MWKKVRSLAKPVRWASFCDPLFLGSPARICLPRLLFLVYLWIAYFPLKSQTPAPLHLCLKWHINLNCPMCLHVSFLWHPVMHICNKIWTFSPVSLSYVNLIISPARRKQKVGQKLVFLHPHRQVTPLLWEIIWGSLYLGLHGISHIKILKKKKKQKTVGLIFSLNFFLRPVIPSYAKKGNNFPTYSHSFTNTYNHSP